MTKQFTNPMDHIRPDLKWTEVNQVLHGLANIMTKEAKDHFYDEVSRTEARHGSNPREVIQAIFFILGVTDWMED